MSLAPPAPIYLRRDKVLPYLVALKLLEAHEREKVLSEKRAHRVSVEKLFQGSDPRGSKVGTSISSTYIAVPFMLLVYYSTIFILEKPKVRSIFPFLVILKTQQ